MSVVRGLALCTCDEAWSHAVVALALIVGLAASVPCESGSRFGPHASTARDSGIDGG